MTSGGDGEVAMLRWPDDRHLASELVEQRSPHLWLVERDVTPPTGLPEFADWIRLPARSEDIEARCLTVLGRAPAVRIDDDGIVTRGRLWDAVPAIEQAVLRPLLSRPGELVLREDLLSAVRPGDDDAARTLAATVMRVRRRMRRLGVVIHTVKGEGFILEIEPLEDS
jgi:DNA-binding response OmpR family regulator